MAFPPGFLDELRARVPIASVVARRVKLVKKGREHTGLCPFHNEKTPSFTVNEDKGFFHCLAGETRVVTWNGTRAIRDLAGGRHVVLTQAGGEARWVEAEFKGYGVQRLHRIVLGRNGVAKEILATDGHRWFVRDRAETVTAQLKPGHRLASVLPPAAVYQPDPAGIRHGVVFGDGFLDSAKGYCIVDLHMDKDELSSWFDGFPVGHYRREGGQPYTQVRNLPSDLKALPPLDAPAGYLAGFVAGHLATDGHVAKDGTVMLHSIDAAALQWVRDACARLGIATLGITTQLRTGYGDRPTPIHRIHILSSSLPEALVLRAESRARLAAARKKFERTRWVVKAVEPTDRVEEVYCAEVPETHCFALDDNILTGNCFGCGAHGDAIGFEMRANHLSFTEAVEKLAAEVGLEVPKATPEERQREARRAGLHDAMEAACRFFEKQLRSPAGREGLQYLRKRGLADDTIARFRLGWAPGGFAANNNDGREALKTALMSGEMPESLLIEAGLLKKPDGPGASFDFFRGRVTFPVTDRRGRVVAFGARTLGDGQPKYLNSPDTPLFHKGSMLYGLAHARQTARERNLALAVEGYMDVIALHEAGFTYAVAPLGTALTEAQIEELWRLADEPILCFDGDAAGQRAMARAAERALPILKPGKSLRFAVLPHPEDPDSLIKARGPAAMQGVLDDAQPLVEVVWALATQGRALDTPERRAALEKELKDKAFGIADESVRWQYLGAFRERMKAAFRPPRQAWSPGQGKRFDGRRRPGDPPLRGPDGKLLGSPRVPPPKSDPRGGAERQLLTLLLVHPALIEGVAERLGEAHFSDSELDKVRRGILKHLDVARDLDSESLRSHLRSDGFSRVLDSLLDANAYKIARPDAAHEAKALWEHIFHLYMRKELQADIGHAAEALAREPSEANFSVLAALVTSRAEGTQDDEDPAGAGSSM